MNQALLLKCYDFARLMCIYHATRANERIAPIVRLYHLRRRAEWIMTIVYLESRLNA